MISRESFFEASTPFFLSKADFEYWWPKVNNFWTQYNQHKGEKLHRTTYYCRLKKHNKSSGPKEAGEGQNIKRRNTSYREADLCDSKLTVKVFLLDNQVEIFTINPHSHPMEDLDIIKKPKALIDFVKKESEKRYLAPAITNVVKQSDLPAAKFVKTKLVYNSR
jgi:hypothetical protein